APDHDAGPGRADEHLDLITPALDVDRGDPGPRQLPADVLPDRDVLMERVRILLVVRVPVRLPPVDDPEPEAVRIHLVSHYRSCAGAGSTTGSSIDSTTSVISDVRFRMRAARPYARGRNR